MRGSFTLRFSRAKLFDAVVQPLNFVLTNKKICQRGAPLPLTQQSSQVTAKLAANRGQHLWVQGKIWHPRGGIIFLLVLRPGSRKSWRGQLRLAHIYQIPRNLGRRWTFLVHEDEARGTLLNCHKSIVSPMHVIGSTIVPLIFSRKDRAQNVRLRIVHGLSYGFFLGVYMFRVKYGKPFFPVLEVPLNLALLVPRSSVLIRQLPAMHSPNVWS